MQTKGTAATTVAPSRQSIKQNKYCIIGLKYVHMFFYFFHEILYNFLAKVKANKYDVFTTDALRSIYGTFYKKKKTPAYFL